MKTVRLLVIDDIVPKFKYGYGYPRALTLYNTFSELGYSLTLVPISAAGKTIVHKNDEINKAIKIVHIREKKEIFNFLAKNIRAYDGIFISRPKNLSFVIDYLLDIKDRPRIIYDVEALNSLREISRLRLEGCDDKRHFEKLIREEISLIRKADLLTCVSHYEMELLRRRIKKEFFFLSHFHNNRVTPNTFDERDGILFIGGFYSVPCPNLDALNFFLNDIFPIIKNKLDVGFRIVGYNAKVLHQKLPQINGNGIKIISDVRSLYKYYNEAKLTVIPTRIGAGISYKFTETLSHGTPSVATKLIAGQVISGKKFYGYDDPVRFADRVIELYRSKRLWTAAREASLEIIENNYTKERLQQEIIRLKDHLRGEK
jgi:glycosyltransferase involved in cell wall biosynthesis